MRISSVRTGAGALGAFAPHPPESVERKRERRIAAEKQGFLPNGFSFPLLV